MDSRSPDFVLSSLAHALLSPLLTFVGWLAHPELLILEIKSFLFTVLRRASYEDA